MLVASWALAALAAGLMFGSVAGQDEADPSPGMDPMSETGEMEPGLHVRDAWSRESMMVDLAGAAYMVIHNNTDADDALIGASSPAAGVVEMHESSMGEDGTMSMMQLEEIPIPAHADTTLEPGGYHIMLIDLAAPLVEGDQIELNLSFANAESQAVMVPITGMAPMGSMDMGEDMEMGGDMDMGDAAEDEG
jgi:copper(I)-binding protein